MNKWMNEKGGTVLLRCCRQVYLYAQLHPVLTVSGEEVSSVVTCFIK